MQTKPTLVRHSLSVIILSLFSTALFADGASPEQVRIWTAHISKSPPNAEVLGGKPYPGATHDTRCSGEKTAETSGRTMVYCYKINKAKPADVLAYYQGAGRPGNGITPRVIEDGTDGFGNSKVLIMYFMRKNNPATKPSPAPVAAAEQPAAAAPAPAPTAISPPTAGNNPPSTPPADGTSDAAKKAGEAINIFRGILGR